jgi:hypothetical protein
MHPIIRDNMMQARVADLHRQAERDRAAQAASRAGRTGRQERRRAGLHHTATVLARRMLTRLAARSPRPGR